MRKIAICMAMVMFLASAAMIAQSENTDAEPVKETHTELMFDIYRISMDGLENRYSPLGFSGTVLAFERGGTGDIAMKTAIDSRGDLSGISGDYDYSAKGPATLYVFVAYAYGDLYIHAGYSQKAVTDGDLYKRGHTGKQYYASGQTVKVTLGSSPEQALRFGIHEKRDSYGTYYNMNGTEYEFVISISGHYCMYYSNHADLQYAYISYTVEYESLSQGEGIIGYVALILGILCVIPIFIFGKREKVYGNEGVSTSELPERDDDDVPDNGRKGRKGRKGKKV